MITTVLVKFGKPVVSLPYRILRLISLCVILMNSIIIIFVFEMFSMAIHIKENVGDYIDLLLDNGTIFSFLVAVPALISLPINALIIFTIVKVFSSNKKVFGVMLFIELIMAGVLLLVFLAAMFMSLSHGYDSDPRFVRNLLEAMGNYSTDGLIKTRIDKLQVEFQCCGSRNYSDWYNIEWYDKNFVKKSEVTVIGEAPFSCCSIRAVFPCIHHGIEAGAGAYSYKIESNFSLSVNGCSDVIEQKKQITSWKVAGYIFCLFALNALAAIPLRLVQTAHNERGKFDKENHVYTSWLFGWFAGKKRTLRREYMDIDSKPPPVPPLPPELMQ